MRLAQDGRMSFRIHIGGLAAEIDARPDETLLDAALRAGLAFPHGCHSGNCGACKCALVAGGVALAPHSRFALDEAERLQGMILACRATPLADCALALAETGDVEIHPLRSLGCRVTACEVLTHDIRRVVLEPVDAPPLAYTPGQYASLRFAGLPARDFSMAGQPGQPALAFHIRLAEGGAVTAHILDHLMPGEIVRLRGPMGGAGWRRAHAGPILAAAGGSGLAPIGAIVDAALAVRPDQEIRLYIGARAERDLYDLARFAARAAAHPGLTVVPVLSAPDGPTARRTGLLADILAADLADLGGWKAYLAGPPAMVESCATVLAARGLAPGDCHADAFYSAADREALLRSLRG